MGHWYCKTCGDKKEPEQVTFNENCRDCGTDVIFVDTVRGILFNKTQGDFYELTGKKPIVYLSGGGVHGTIEYVEYLEKQLNSDQS